ncbi:histidine kinase [Emticicia sp. CRIBPO]|uniref:sensor histidine kinase n=1 Tax=Emticicia sp. CRIBPO TaxID=2683258 RepID=UPI0014136883|nr:histidine kinase [Emticicia sp. CRIBPO]NBA88044.1 histidine kinase [Emticicia sp. CRIBPO]
MDNDQNRLNYQIDLIPVTLAQVPFFYFNSEYLIYRFIPKGKIPSYIVSLLLLFVVFLFIHYQIKDYIVDSHPVRFYDFRNIFPVVFIISMSTLYGLITFMIRQTKVFQEEQEERLKSELSFLRSQISPHFIFNVLNSIVYLIRIKSDLAERVTIELSELIRYMLYESDNKQVALEKEIQYLQNYIELQRIRFGDDVPVHISFNGDFSNKTIEPMLLIPFVENAFKHGVGMVKSPKITVNVNCSDSVFDFEVTNCIGPETSDQKDSNSGIGLKNVTRRLELLYPGSHSLSIFEKDGNFIANLKIELKNSN